MTAYVTTGVGVSLFIVSIWDFYLCKPSRITESELCDLINFLNKLNKIKYYLIIDGATIALMNEGKIAKIP